MLIAIAVHWQTSAEAWPSQEALARFSGWSSRAVRDQANAFERGGFLRLRRERRAETIRYVHRMYDSESRKIVAMMNLLVIYFDLDARKSAELPASVVEACKAMLEP